MKKDHSIILVILIYLLFFLGAFGIISFYTDFKLFADTHYQLYIGIICAIVGFIVFLLAIRNGNSYFIEADSEIENDNNSSSIENEEVDNKISVNDESDNNLSNNYEVINNDDEALDKDNISEININQENELSNFQEEIVNDYSNNDVNISENDKVNTDSITLNIDSNDAIEIDAENKVDNQTINREQLIEKVSEDVNDILTNTQIMYINKSDNSYFNTQGLPQLVITGELSNEKIQKAIQQKKLAIEKQKQQEEIDQDFDDSLYDDEKTHNIIDFLTKTIIVLIIGIVIVGGYYLYSHYIG